LADYLARHQIDLGRVLPRVGAIGLLDVVEYPLDRFDFVGRGDLIACLVFEALDDDEQPFDLVALPVSEPGRPMTMFGRVGFLNPATVFWPGSYSLGKSMPVHRHGLAWLQAGCVGTAIIHPKVASRQMLDVPGPLLGQDRQHCRELIGIARSVVNEAQFVMPAPAEIARAA
jgi:hypothetical protein